MINRALVCLAALFLACQCAGTSCDPLRLARDAGSTPNDAEEETDGPDQAWNWRRLRWQDEHGQIAPDALQSAMAQRNANLDAFPLAGPSRVAGIDPLHWVERGPNNVGGRTRAIWIQPTNPSRIVAGSVGGGLWLSTNNGTTWAPVNDHLQSLAICCLAGDPQNPNVVYAGTGEGFFNGDALGGVGIYKSVDAGSTWTLMPSTTNFGNVCRIAVSPTNSNIILASIRYGGIRRSTNGGTTWSTPLSAQGSFFVAFHPTDGLRAVATIIDYDFNTNEWFHAALYSTNSGITWTPAGGLTRLNGFDARIELAYARSQPTTVYASVATDGGKIWRSTDGGQTYALRTTTGSSGVNWYANPLWVDPTNPDMLVTGGYHLFKSVNGGTSLTQISDGYILTAQAHPDQHTIIEDPGFNSTTNRRVYVGNDGGVFRADNIDTASTTGGWSSLSPGYRTVQYYGAAGHGPTGLIVGGTQDNGTLRLATGSNSAVLTFGGDGGFCAIDPTNPNYTYGEYVTLQIHRSTNGGMSAGYIFDGIADAGTAANFIAPFILDPNLSARMLAGGRSLWRTNNARATVPAWTSIRPPGSDNISAIAVAPGNSDIIWIGQNDGQVWKTTNGQSAAPAWIAVDDNASSDPLPDRYVTRIVIDPANASVAYVAFGGFSPDNLYRTTNAGGNWTDITGALPTGLPDAPIYGFARHPQHADWLYAGTEVGIFASDDGGATWSTSNLGPANVSVDELVFMHNSVVLLAATHGRGIFTIVTFVAGDLNCDGVVNNFDIAPFVLVLTDPAEYAVEFPNCDINQADVNHDGAINNFDIQAFVACLTGGCP